MSSFDSVVAQSAFDALRDLPVHRCSSAPFWDSKNITKHGKFMRISLLLLGEKNSVIHGFIPAARATHLYMLC
ncbi:hypothetical protein Bca101_083113 [Brassica carinata]